MRSYLLAVLVFFSSSASAQNIVPNSNFAQHTGCPDIQSMILLCDHWNTMTIGTPDYYNACAPGVIVDMRVPSNEMGFQESHSNAYVGAISFGGVEPNAREYITTNIPPLEAGAVYRVTLVVSLASKAQFASAGLGVYFYLHNKPDTMTFDNPVLPQTPQVDFSDYGIITDTTNWVVLTHEFVPDSAYTHLVIGNYHDDNNIDTVALHRGSQVYAYYYYDSFAVEKVHPAGITEAGVQDKVSAYPNPFTVECTLTFKNTTNSRYTLSLLNVQGSG